MDLNIKNERVCTLAKEAARVTGRTQTGAIEEALERLLAEYGVDPAAAEAERRYQHARRIVLEYAQDPGDPDSEIRTPEDLYDEATGLPR